jgi:hypothetical protein
MVIKGLFIPCPRWWALVFLIGVQAMPLPAQEFGPRQGLLLGSGAISPGFMLHRSMTNIYVSGHLEYFVDEAVSIRGRGAWYVDAQQEPALLRENSQLSAGPWFHTGKGRLDLHAGFEPGISFTSLVIGTGRLRVLPTLDVGAGATWYVWDHFHFFAQLRYHRARYPGLSDGALPLDELVVAGGLGFQLRVRR